MRQLTKPITKVVSIFLTVLMLSCLFTIVPFSVGAAGDTHTLTVDLFEPCLTDDYDENIAIETKIGQAGAQISVTARLKNNDYRFHVTGMTMTYTQDGEAKTLDAELEILDAYRNVKAEFTMPSADARISFKVEEIYYVRVTSNAYGAVSADRIRVRKGDKVNISATPNSTARPYYKLYAAYEWDTATEQAEIMNNSSFIMPANSDVTVYAEYFDAVANYIERSWDGEKVVANERIRTPSEGYIKMSEVADSGTLQDGNWYYVDSNVTFSGRIHTDGEVNIILGDGATVDFQRGLEVSEGDTLNVYDLL